MVETQLEFESQIPADWEAPSGEREVQEQSLAKVGRVDQGKSQEEGAEEEERTDDECVSPAPYDSDPRVARLPHEPTLKRGLASEQLPGSTGSLELSGPPAKSPKLGSASSTKPEDDPNAKAPKPAEPRAAPEAPAPTPAEPLAPAAPQAQAPTPVELPAPAAPAGEPPAPAITQAQASKPVDSPAPGDASEAVAPKPNEPPPPPNSPAVKPEVIPSDEEGNEAKGAHQDSDFERSLIVPCYFPVCW